MATVSRTEKEPACLDKQAFAALYERTAERVFRYAWSIVRDESTAEDVCAEAYLRAWESRGRFRGDAQPLSWLLTITRNCAISELRSRRVRHRRSHPCRGDELAQDDGVATKADPESVAIVRADVGRLSCALQHLTENQRRVIFLRFFEDLRPDEIGQILDRNATAVRAAQFRALHRLRVLMVPDRE